MNRTGRSGGFALLLVVSMIAPTLAACRSAPPAGPMLVSRTGVPLAVDDERADRVLGDYLETLSSRRGLRGSARVALTGPDFKLNRPQRIVVERPASLRFEILGLFDQLAAILATDGREFGFFEAATGEITRGPVSPSLLWDLAKIDLSAEEAVGLLLGTPEPAPGVARSAVWMEPDGRIALAFAWPVTDPAAACLSGASSVLFDPECFVGEAALAEGGEVFFFDEGGRLVELRSLEAAGVIRLRVLFEGYEPLDAADGVIFPKRITIRSPAVLSEARFDWKRVMFATDLSDRLFVLPEPRRTGRGG